MTLEQLCKKAFIEGNTLYKTYIPLDDWWSLFSNQYRAEIKLLNQGETPERSIATELNSNTEPLPNKELPTLEPEQAVEKPKVVCFCGSTRFTEWFMVKRWELEKQGIITLGINILPREGHHFAEQEGVKHILDQLHKRNLKEMYLKGKGEDQ